MASLTAARMAPAAAQSPGLATAPITPNDDADESRTAERADIRRPSRPSTKHHAEEHKTEYRTTSQRPADRRNLPSKRANLGCTPCERAAAHDDIRVVVGMFVGDVRILSRHPAEPLLSGGVTISL